MDIRDLFSEGDVDEDGNICLKVDVQFWLERCREALGVNERREANLSTVSYAQTLVDEQQRWFEQLTPRSQPLVCVSTCDCVAGAQLVDAKPEPKAASAPRQAPSRRVASPGARSSSRPDGAG